MTTIKDIIHDEVMEVVKRTSDIGLTKAQKMIINNALIDLRKSTAERIEESFERLIG